MEVATLVRLASPSDYIHLRAWRAHRPPLGSVLDGDTHMRSCQEHRSGMPPIDPAAVIESITATGMWQRNVEWRISTETLTQIRRTGEPGYRAYHVRVACSFIFEAHCPTITRSIQIAARYELLVQELWSELGWPSWASIDQLEPPPGAI